MTKVLAESKFKRRIQISKGNHNQQTSVIVTKKCIYCGFCDIIFFVNPGYGIPTTKIKFFTVVYETEDCTYLGNKILLHNNLHIQRKSVIDQPYFENFAGGGDILRTPAH